MRLPGWLSRRSASETRSYASAVVEAAVAAASGNLASTSAIGATEIAAGWWSRGLAGADDGDLLGAATLAYLGRQLALHGDALLELRVEGGALVLVPSCDWEVFGSASPASWTYRATFAGPDGSVSRRLSPERVIHVRINQEPDRPWAGRSHVAAARDSGQLASAIESRLRNEARSPSGYLLAVPDSDLSQISADLAKLAGGVLMLPTTANAFGAGQVEAPRRDWIGSRLGLDPPAALVALREAVEASVLACYGVPILSITGAGGQREARIGFTRRVMMPLGRVIADEVGRKLDRPGFSFAWPEVDLLDRQAEARIEATRGGGAG